MTKQLATLALAAVVVAAGLLWYLFRPDALVISKTVHEPFPAVQESGSMVHESAMASVISRISIPTSTVTSCRSPSQLGVLRSRRLTRS